MKMFGSKNIKSSNPTWTDSEFLNYQNQQTFLRGIIKKNQEKNKGIWNKNSSRPFTHAYYCSLIRPCCFWYICMRPHQQWHVCACECVCASNTRIQQIQSNPCKQCIEVKQWISGRCIIASIFRCERPSIYVDVHILFSKIT